ILRDESETLRVVEPLHGALGHVTSSFERGERLCSPGPRTGARGSTLVSRIPGGAQSLTARPCARVPVRELATWYERAQVHAQGSPEEPRDQADVRPVSGRVPEQLDCRPGGLRQ